MIGIPDAPHAPHCYHGGWSHCHWEGIDVQTITCLVFWVGDFVFFLIYLCTSLIPILGHTGQWESPSNSSLCCLWVPRSLACLPSAVHLYGSFLTTSFMCDIQGVQLCLAERIETSVFTSSSWKQKVSLTGYIVQAQLAGFTDGLDMGCDRKDTEW